MIFERTYSKLIFDRFIKLISWCTLHFLIFSKLKSKKAKQESVKVTFGAYKLSFLHCFKNHRL
jgi:hypothetical protein